ncbi:MAG: HlyD family efflux transporter periplasmic adaptor subunit [Pirellulales bacterium]
MASTIDLQQLTIQRAGDKPAARKRKRHLLTRYVLPLGMLCAFVGLLAWSARASFSAATPVTVTPVIVSRAEVQQSGTPLFQAAGWVEPRPTPVMATALTEGVVDQLLVVQGQEVKKGEPVATLIDADARIALDDSEAALELREAECEGARATLNAAQTKLQQPLELQAALADAESALAKVEGELLNLPFAIHSAEARLRFTEEQLSQRRRAEGAVAGRLVQQAENDYIASKVALDELNSRKPNLERQIEKLRQKRDTLQKQLDLKTDQTKQVGEAAAAVKATQARCRQAELAVEAAKLRFDRMTIRSPISGRVLSLNARPGQRLMGLSPASERDASVVVSLYDPKMLQVRADVRLEDVRQVQIGAPVQIETAAATAPISGEVLSITSSADIAKNTLEVKVSVSDPPSAIRPEMLARVTFLAPKRENQSSESKEQLQMLIPRQLVNQAGESAEVWVADQHNSIAQRQTVRLGRAGTEELVEVIEGLTVTDKLIVGGREGVEDGGRITITGLDTTLGASRGVAVASQATIDSGKKQ